ncbi:succinate dehydrogenase, hydrophobic membrane anchor protein [Brevundimonas sp. BAL450]|uniref:Succinate dehydrogenase hydrophobic membrane anchor subunit n=1 Tax=Brevundimonas abyssalis TAR-001 TaxID=1391729 RepID=A0A8E0TTG8_9CAUL|nr:MULTISPECIES: succinate dehydrogenase, hydrophobic membrane anchor protein [Brevundimonas]MBG7616257.1 succinate dehydrogenase, hydrophobic membrane anchor protein [Brevundimonas sp. BAL450]GAD60251.1 succinate dehydrogenase hydrophobic membrane anchor protein [Brevundimonas abyssalis TAR-001]
MSGYAQYKNRVKISERYGAREWVVERVALLLLMPLGVWAAFSAFTLTGADYDTATAWFASPFNAVLLGVTAVVFLGYISLAWKVIIEDYIHRPGNKALLIGLSNLIFLVLAATSIFFITRLALGSAPLPAGFGA